MHLAFAGEILRRKLGDGELVGLRTPLVVVDAIENPGHGGGAVAQHAFQPKSVFGGLDFLAVLPADRGDEVGICQRAFQEIDLAEKFHLRHREEIPRQHQQRQSIGREQSLIAHVVDGEDSADVPEGGVLRIDRAQQHRNQRRLPIVAVKNLRHAENLRRFEHGAGEQSEAFGVIGIIAGGCAVERVAVEVRRIFDKIKSHAALAASGDNRGEAIFVIERDGDAADHSGGISELGLAIARQIDADLMPERGKRAWQERRLRRPSRRSWKMERLPKRQMRCS